MLSSAATFTTPWISLLYASSEKAFKKSQKTITLDKKFRNFQNKLALLCFLTYGVQ